MPITLSSKAAKLLARETKAFATLALVLKDGTPQATPIWFDWDGTHIIVNTAKGSVKANVMSKQPKVALSIMALDDPYNYIQVVGQVVAEDEAEGRAMIDRLAQKYLGTDFPWYRGEARATYKILPEKITP